MIFHSENYPFEHIYSSLHSSRAQNLTQPLLPSRCLSEKGAAILPPEGCILRHRVCVSVQFKSAIIRGDWGLWMYQGRGKRSVLALYFLKRHFPCQPLPEFSVFLCRMFGFKGRKRKFNDTSSLHESYPMSAPYLKWIVLKAQCQIRLFAASATLAL